MQSAIFMQSSYSCLRKQELLYSKHVCNSTVIFTHSSTELNFKQYLNIANKTPIYPLAQRSEGCKYCQTPIGVLVSVLQKPFSAYLNLFVLEVLEKLSYSPEMDRSIVSDANGLSHIGTFLLIFFIHVAKMILDVTKTFANYLQVSHIGSTAI